MLNYIRALLVVADPTKRKAHGANLETGFKLVLIKDDIKEFQKLVGGYVEAVHISSDTIMLVNEDGKSRRLQPNFYLRYKGTKNDGYRVIVGNAIFVGSKNDSFVSISNKQLAIIKHELTTSRGLTM